MANPAGNLAGGTTILVVPDTGDEAVVPVCAPDGRVVFVPVSRRILFHGAGATAAGLTGLAGQAATPAPAAPHRATLPTGTDLIEHFQQLRQTLIDNDRLFGPRQVIPLVRAQIGIMQQLRPRWHGTDRQELLRVQAQYSELCGWLYQDAGEHHLAESWTDRALGLSHLTEDQELTAHILVRRADIACDTRVPVDAIGASEKSLRIASQRSRIAAIAPTYAGHGYALSGDDTAMERAYDCARELLNTCDADPEGSPPGPWFDEKWIALRRAQSLAVLGDYHRAAESFLDAIADLPGRYRRGRGVWLARTSHALANDHQVEHAATLGLEALAIGADTRSERILTELNQLDNVLTPWNAVPAVAEFRTAIKDIIPRQA